MRTRHLYRMVVAAPLMLIAATGYLRPRLLEDMRNFVFDTYQRIEPRAYSPDAAVRIVDIDEVSLQRIGQWPWPRGKLAELTKKMAAAGAAAIAFDVTFPEPDRSNLDQIAAGLPEGPAKALLLEIAAKVESNDALFAAENAGASVVLGAILTDAVAAPDGFPVKSGLAFAGDDPLPFPPVFSGAVLPLPLLHSGASGVGVLNWLPSRDQVIRDVPLVMRMGNQIVPSLALETLRVGQGASTLIVRASNASGQTSFGEHTGINAVKVGALNIETGAQGEIRVYFSPSDPRRFIPAWKVLAGEFEPDALRDRLVIVGTSAEGLLDQRATPIEPSVAGVEVHAQIMEHILSGASLSRPDWANGVETVAALAMGLIFAIVIPLASPVYGALFGAACVAALAGFSWYSFRSHGVLVDPLFPSLSSGAVYLSGLVFLFWNERSQKRMVRRAFGKFVSPAVVARLAESPDLLVLGGESRVLTLMFCDLRDFTAMSEGLGAQGIIQFMNDYLTPMTDVILASTGTVDKYMGDAIMAFWNAPLDDPDHAANAARAAIAMQGALAAFNAGRKAKAEGAGARFKPARFGIGLNTGICSVGNLGSIQRFDYSAIGDPVNVASRLEGVTKIYGVEVLAAQETRDSAPAFAWLELDHVRVKGRAQPTTLHALAGDADFAKGEEFAAWRAAHAGMMEAYRAADFERAILRAGEAGGHGGAAWANAYATFAGRFSAMRAEGVTQWDGVRVLTEK